MGSGKGLGKKGILLNDDQGRLPEVRGKIPGKKTLGGPAGIGIPDTILRWHRERAARHRGSQAAPEESWAAAAV